MTSSNSLEQLATELQDAYISKDGNNYRISSQDSTKVDTLNSLLTDIAANSDNSSHMSVKQVDNHLDVKNPLASVAVELRRALQKQQSFSSQEQAMGL
jgi:hypothetical protein